MSCYVYSSRLFCIISCEMLRMEERERAGPKTTKALRFAPSLFIWGKHTRVCTRHTNNPRPDDNSTHLFLSLHHYQFFSPLLQAFFHSTSPSPFHYDPFATSLLAPSPSSPPAFLLTMWPFSLSLDLVLFLLLHSLPQPPAIFIFTSTSIKLLGRTSSPFDLHIEPAGGCRTLP